MKKLNQRDKRALKLGVVGVAAIFAFVFGSEWLDRWQHARGSLQAKRKQLQVISPSRAKQEALLAIVPVFEMPQEEEKQKFLFRSKLNEQLKKAGIKGEPLRFQPIGTSRHDEYKLLRLQCRAGKCKFGQVLDLLAVLKDNPYLVGVEKFEMKCDPKKREEFELNMIVSTFVK
jgi:hypothetical protein